jgi:hypothetical protein
MVTGGAAGSAAASFLPPAKAKPALSNKTSIKRTKQNIFLFIIPPMAKYYDITK